MSIRVWRRAETGSANYVADKTKPSNKNCGSGEVHVSRMPGSPEPEGAANLSGSGRRTYGEYSRKFDVDKSLLGNQDKSEGSDIPRPLYDPKAR